MISDESFFKFSGDTYFPFSPLTISGIYPYIPWNQGFRYSLSKMKYLSHIAYSFD